jgi:hypothetical protein
MCTVGPLVHGKKCSPVINGGCKEGTKTKKKIILGPGSVRVGSRRGEGHF